MKRGVLWIALLLLSSALLVFFALRPSAVPETMTEQDFQELVSFKISRWSKQNGKAMERFSEELERESLPEFKTALLSVPATVEELCSWKNILTIAFGKNGEKLAAKILMEKTGSACLRGNRAADKALQRFCYSLNAHNMKCRAELAVFAAKIPDCSVNPIPSKAFAEEMETFLAKTRESSIDASLSGMEGLLETAFLRSTASAVSGALRSAAARFSGGAAAGCVSAAADGPMPFGDAAGAAIAAGGAVWTAFDLVRARQVLPKRLADRLSEGIGKCRDAALDSARKRANEALAAAEADLAAIPGEIKGQTP